MSSNPRTGTTNSMTQSKTISLTTKKQFELVDITSQISTALTESNVQSGAVVIFTPHTTASIRINHNEPLLTQDLMKMLYRVVPIDANYSHDLFEMRSVVATNERSNGHAHVKAFLLGSSETIPVHEGKLVLGDRQSVFFVELDGGRSRNFIIQILGEK
jgi:secondary thiamine-phosphate synthase enzyme